MSAHTPVPVDDVGIDVNAVRDVLKGIPGIIRVVHVRTKRGEESVWVVRDDVEFERDRRIVEALTDLEVFDGHLLTVSTQGMVPDGRVIL